MMASGGSATGKVYPVKPNAPKYFKDATNDVGVKEWIMVGAKKKSNPIVEEYALKAIGQRMDAISVPWCAYWLNAKLVDAGYPSTQSGMARSFLKYGTEINKNDATKWRQGDIGVTWRGSSDDGVTGHTFFIDSWDDHFVIALGGNQNDSVNYQRISRSKLLGVRRPKPLSSSRTVQSGGGAVASEGARQITENTIPDPLPVDPSQDLLDTWHQMSEPLQVLAQLKPWLLGLFSTITVALILFALYCRYQDYKKGKNA